MRLRPYLRHHVPCPVAYGGCGAWPGEHCRSKVTGRDLVDVHAARWDIFYRRREMVMTERTPRDKPAWPVQPGYLQGLLTVPAELDTGHIDPNGYVKTDDSTKAVVAVSYVEGYAYLAVETGDGRLIRLRIGGDDWLALAGNGNADRQVARSRAGTYDASTGQYGGRSGS